MLELIVPISGVEGLDRVLGPATSREVLTRDQIDRGLAAVHQGLCEMVGQLRPAANEGTVAERFERLARTVHAEVFGPSAEGTLTFDRAVHRVRDAAAWSQRSFADLGPRVDDAFRAEQLRLAIYSLAFTRQELSRYDRDLPETVAHIAYGDLLDIAVHTASTAKDLTPFRAALNHPDDRGMAFRSLDRLARIPASIDYDRPRLEGLFEPVQQLAIEITGQEIDRARRAALDPSRSSGILRENRTETMVVTDEVLQSLDRVRKNWEIK